MTDRIIFVFAIIYLRGKMRRRKHMNYVKEEDNWVFAECSECNMIMKFKKNELNLDKAKKMYTLGEPIECFCGEMSGVITDVPVAEENKAVVCATSTLSYTTPVKNIPHCPTCGSANITRISLGAKAVGGAMFGIFSSNIRNSYKCNNCGYKW